MIDQIKLHDEMAFAAAETKPDGVIVNADITEKGATFTISQIKVKKEGDHIEIQYRDVTDDDGNWIGYETIPVKPTFDRKPFDEIAKKYSEDGYKVTVKISGGE